MTPTPRTLLTLSLLATGCSSPVPPRLEALEITGLDTKQITTMVNHDLPAFGACHAAAAKPAPRTVRVEVVLDSTMTDVRTSGADAAPAFETCIAKAAMAMELPPPTSGSARVTFSLVFGG